MTDARKCAFLCGMSAHVATDTFAHSAYVNGEHIDQGTNSSTGADSVTTYPNRNDCAQQIAGLLAGQSTLRY